MGACNLGKGSYEMLLVACHKSVLIVVMFNKKPFACLNAVYTSIPEMCKIFGDSCSSVVLSEKWPQICNTLATKLRWQSNSRRGKQAKSRVSNSKLLHHLVSCVKLIETNWGNLKLIANTLRSKRILSVRMRGCRGNIVEMRSETLAS